MLLFPVSCQTCNRGWNAWWVLVQAEEVPEVASNNFIEPVEWKGVGVEALELSLASNLCHRSVAMSLSAVRVARSRSTPGFICWWP